MDRLAPVEASPPSSCVSPRRCLKKASRKPVVEFILRSYIFQATRLVNER